MLAPYSLPDKGLVTLFPYHEVGDDLAMALHKIGAGPGRPPQAAFGYGLIVSTTGQCLRLTAKTEAQARAQAAMHALIHPVVLTRAVARARVTLYERLERVLLAAPSTMDNLSTALLVAPGGLLVEKQPDVYNAVDLRATAKKLAGQLRHVDRQVLRPRLEGFLKRLDVDWEKMTPTQLRNTLDRAHDFMRRQATERALPLWQSNVRTTLNTVAKKGRKQIRHNFLPRMALSFTRDELDALDRISNQQGWFMRDFHKRISGTMTARARTIVEDGLKKGLGRVEIGKRLYKQIPGMWQGMGQQYANVVAANAVTRARSWAEVTSYQAAGIELLEVQAVLDERTTDICRFMDGQIINVADAARISQEGANVKRPEQIYDVNPFMGIVDVEGGGQELQTATGGRIAIMDRSGVGNVNDRGEFRALVGGRQLPDHQVGPPPYHHYCRSTTVPRVDSFQVPSNFEARALSIPGTAPGPVPKPPTRPPPGPVPGVFPKPPARKPPKPKPPGRPTDLHPRPDPTNPVPMGDPLNIDSFTIDEQFLARPPQGYATSHKNFGTMTAQTPDTTGLSRFVPSGTETTLTMDDLRLLRAGKESNFFATIGENAQAVVRIGARNPMLQHDIAALAVSPQAVGKDLIFRIAPRTGAEQYVRIVYSQSQKSMINTALKNLQAGTWSEAQASKWLVQAEKRGWIKRGSSLQSVSNNLARRVGTASGTPTPGKLPKKVGTPPTAKKPPVPPPDRPPPVPKVKPQPLKVGLKGREMTWDVYAARPTSKKMAEAAWEQSHAYVQTRTVDATGKIKVKKRWSKFGMGDEHFPTPKLRDLKLTDGDHVVTIFSPGVANKKTFRKMYGDIIEAELKRGYKGVREYIITDVRGQSFFVRYDGIAAAAMDDYTLRTMLQNLNTTWNSEVALAQLRSSVASSTTQLRKFYPKAQLDWSKGNLLPGVHIEEQVAHRIAAVKKEITDEIKKLGAVTDKEIEAALNNVMKRGAGRGKASRHYPGSNPVKETTNPTGKLRENIKHTSPDTLRSKIVVEAQETANLAFDAALEHASEGLRTAMQTRHMPTVVRRQGWGRSWEATGTGYGHKGTPSVIDLGNQARVELAYGEAATGSPLSAKAAKDTVRHEVQHHIDDIGLNGFASQAARNLQIRDGKLVNIYNKKGKKIEWGLPGDFMDKYDGRIYGTNNLMAYTEHGTRKKYTAEEWRDLMTKSNREAQLTARSPGNEFMSTAQGRIANGGKEMVDMWKNHPDQMANYIATMRGAYTPY